MLTRRTLVAGIAAGAGVALGRPAGAAAADAPLVNPVVRQRADAQVFRHTDGTYYMTGSVPEYDRLILRRARTLEGLASAPERVIWRRPARGRMGGYIWAPELHEIEGRWHLFFAAGDSADPFHIRTYVLRGPAGDPYLGRWDVLGQLQTPWDSFTLDSTSFVHRGTRYLCWAQQEPGIDTNSNLYLAPLATPITLARRPVRLSVPTLAWEIQGFKVNEAPSFLARNGRVFLSYSASATDARYCLGLLSADANADLMAAASWSKSPLPVFTSCDATRVYGPGHNSFTVDERGRDVLVYHGRDYREIQGDPLFDPNRHTRVQRLYYRPDGTPDFGIPVGNGALPERFSPLDDVAAFLRHDGDGLRIGAGAVAGSQFRQRAGLGGAVSLEPIDAPGRRLCAHADGTVSLVVDDGSRSVAERSSFHRVPGLADRRGVSFVAYGPGGAYLRQDGARLIVGAPIDGRGRLAATFLPS